MSVDIAFVNAAQKRKKIKLLNRKIEIPDSIRNINSGHVDYFKNHLDVFLSSIPDQPTVTGLGRAAESNSLQHQLPLFYSMTV